MKKVLLLLSCVLYIVAASAQSTQCDVVYLKDGSTIRGIIQESKHSDSLKITTLNGNVLIYRMDEVDHTEKENVSNVLYAQNLKNPALAGIMSFLVPGVGQFYVGNKRQGWTDIMESVSSLMLMKFGSELIEHPMDKDGYLSQREATSGTVLILGGIVWLLANNICSIVNAARGANAYNQANGLATIDLGNDVKARIHPTLSYDSAELAMGSAGSMTAGLGLTISF